MYDFGVPFCHFWSFCLPRPTPPPIRTAQTKYIKKEIAGSDLSQLESLVDELGERLAELQEQYAACVRPVTGAAEGHPVTSPGEAVTSLGTRPTVARGSKVLKEDGRRLASG